MNDDIARVLPKWKKIYLKLETIITKEDDTMSESDKDAVMYAVATSVDELYKEYNDVAERYDRFKCPRNRQKKTK